MIFDQNPDDPNSWTDIDCLFGKHEMVELTVETNGEAPDEKLLAQLSEIVNDSYGYTLAAAKLILENYSYDHFAQLGVDESLLVDETVDGVAEAISLESVFVINAQAKSFEMSFAAPWDPHHSFDVEFENGNAITCAVNG